MTLTTIDETDLRILNMLLDNSALAHKEIGALVHLTGQAVGARIRKLQELGVIEGYTLRWNPDKLGLTVHALVTVFMKSGAAHSAFQAFALRRSEILEAHRIGGEGCYWLRVRVDSQAALNALLDELLHYGNYKISLSIGRIK